MKLSRFKTRFSMYLNSDSHCDLTVESAINLFTSENTVNLRKTSNNEII